MPELIHRDPTFDQAYGWELAEKRGCAICVRRRTLCEGGVRCSVGKTFPECRRHRNGFSVDMGRGNG